MHKWLLIFLLTLAHLLRSVRTKTTSQIYGEQLLNNEWSIYRTGPFGDTRGRSGQFFTDFKQSLNGRAFKPDRWPDTINVRAGRSIDGIKIFYGGYQGDFHGGYGGYLNKIRLYNGDKIVKVSGRHGQGPGAEVNQLQFHTKNGLTLGPFGGEGGVPFQAVGPRDKCFLGWISGLANDRLSSITFHWKCPADPEDNKTYQHLRPWSDHYYFESSNADSGRTSSAATHHFAHLFTVLIAFIISS